MVRRLTEEDLAEPRHAGGARARGARRADRLLLGRVRPDGGPARSTREASASWPATTSSPRATSACRSWASDSSTTRATSDSSWTPRAGRPRRYPMLEPEELPLAVAETADGSAADRLDPAGRPPGAPPDPPGQGRARAAAAARLESSGERDARPRGHGAAVRRRTRDCGSSRRSCWASAARARSRRSARVHDPPHQRGARGVRVAREDPAPRPGGAPLASPRRARSRRPATSSRRTRRSRRGSTSSRRSCSGSTSAATSTISRSDLRRVLRPRPRGRRAAPRALLDGGPRDAALDAPERGLAACTPPSRAGSGGASCPDLPLSEVPIRADHQRRPRGDLDGARDRGDRRAEHPEDVDRAELWRAHEELRARLVAACREKLAEERRSSGLREEEIEEASRIARSRGR